MINDKTALQLQGMASMGANLELDGRAYTALQLQGIASVGKPKGAKLIIHHSEALTALQMQGIASVSPGNVTFK